MKWRRADDWHWARECGRYTVTQSLAFDRNPQGHWVYLAWHKPETGEPGECISPERRHSLEDAVADCSHHIRQHQQRHRAA